MIGCAKINTQDKKEKPTDNTIITVFREGIKEKMLLLHTVLEVIPPSTHALPCHKIVEFEETNHVIAKSEQAAHFTSSSRDEYDNEVIMNKVIISLEHTSSKL